MTKVDLVTGFLGSGKTSFIRRYAQYYIDKGQRIGIIENDFGAVNVDMMLLSDLEGDSCELEMVSGGCDKDCHIRRFKTKLIALGMQHLDRVIVEPSGIFDVDEFFDVISEEPLDRLLEKGSVITVVDGKLSDEDISPVTKYMLASQISCAGCVLLSRTQELDVNQVKHTKELINKIVSECQCERVLGDEIVDKCWDDLNDEDYADIANSGMKNYSMPKQFSDSREEYNSFVYMNLSPDEGRIKKLCSELFDINVSGRLMRIKGFFKNAGGSWMELNATYDKLTIRPVHDGQDVIIVIGEDLDESEIMAKIDGIFC